MYKTIQHLVYTTLCKLYIHNSNSGMIKTDHVYLHDNITSKISAFSSSDQNRLSESQSYGVLI